MAEVEPIEPALAPIDEKLRRAAAANHALAERRRATLEAGFVGTSSDVQAMANLMRPEWQREPLRMVEDDPPSEATAVPPNVLEQLVPPRFAMAAFTTYEPRRTSQRGALRAVESWVAAAQAGAGPMLALIGPTGTGKSHLLYAATNALLGTPPRFPLACYARPWYRLANELRYGGRSPYKPSDAWEPSDVRAMLYRQPTVLLDEVRPTAGTAFDDTELALFACHAYDALTAVLITTNVHPLENVMGAPAASRFTQVIVDGPDWRQP